MEALYYCTKGFSISPSLLQPSRLKTHLQP